MTLNFNSLSRPSRTTKENMVLTVAQTTNFFQQNAQMDIPAATVAQLVNEGISTVDDLMDFDKDSLEQVANNLRRLPGGAAAFTFGAKSLKRLIIACDLIRYYETVGRNVTAANLQWTPIMRNFGEQWKALMDRKEEDEPDTPVISKELPVMQWVESFRDYLQRCIGVRNIPLVYVIRPDVAVPNPITGQAPNQPYTDEHGSIEEDLIARASHTHGLYKDDNASVYYRLEEATRSTPYADTIKPFQRCKDGRAAFESLSNQYAGVDKWELELKKQDRLLHTRKWRGQNNYSLEKFCQHHRAAYVSMVSCSQHVEFQLPNGHTRVGYLLDAIENNDAQLQAAMANVRDDTGDGTAANPGKRNDFELAVAYILPSDPVARKRTITNKRGAAEISALGGASNDKNGAGFGDKPGIGSTGVHLRWHSPKEFKQLSKKQKRELFEWRKTQESDEPGDSKKGKKRAKAQKEAIAAAVEKKVEEKLAKLKNEEKQQIRSDDDARAYIMSLFPTDAPTENKPPPLPPKPSEVGSTSSVRKVTLQSILRKAKN